MTVEELIVYGKSKISSTHAKMLLAILLDVNSLELLTMLDSVVSDEIVQDYKEKFRKFGIINRFSTLLVPLIFTEIFFM